MARLALLLLSMLTLLAASACVSRERDTASPPPPLPTPTPIDPQALFEESGRAMRSLDTFRFRLEHEGGGTPLAENLLLVRAEGTVAKPDGIAVDFSGSVGGFAVKASLVSLGMKSYMTNPLTGQWEDVPQEVSPLSFFDPQAGIESIMMRVVDPRLASFNGETYSLEATIPADALAPLFGLTLPGSPVSVEAVVDAESMYLVRATLTGKITPGEQEGVVRIIRLSEFNEPAEISAPPGMGG